MRRGLDLRQPRAADPPHEIDAGQGAPRRARQVAELHGLPLNLDGTESPRSQSTRAFARNVADLAPVLLWDERWSTVAAERAMIDQDLSRAKRAERIDNHAAAIILQGAIDALTMG